MGILFSEVKYNSSEVRDFSDPLVNGGGKGDEVVNDTLHSLFPEISASEREVGFTRYTKFFVTNESTTRKMQDCIFYIKQDVLPPDRLRMFAATESAHIDFDNVTELLGGTSAVASGTSIEIENILPAGVVAGDLVGREIDIAGTKFNVASSANDTHIALAEQIDIDIAAGYTVSTSDDFDYTQDDENFVTAKPLINSVLKSTVTIGTTEIFIPMIDKDLFEVGDSIIILDGYFRAVYRGDIDAIADHGTDPLIAIITLTKAYTSTVAIPSNGGFISNGNKRDLLPGETASFWLELLVDPSDAVDAEIVNQFQLGTHFDDVTA